MWPFSEMSLAGATLWSDVANAAFLISLLVGVIATFAIVRLVNVKEAFWDIARRESAEKISGLNKDTARLTADAAASRAAVAEANASALDAKRDTVAALERIASLNKDTARLSADADASKAAIAGANARALEAQAELARFKADRMIKPEDQERIVSAIKPFAGQEYFLSVATDQESLRFVKIIDPLLALAGWIKMPPTSAIKVQGIDAGISVASEPGVRIQLDPSRKDDPEFRRRAFALGDALTSSGIAAVVVLVPAELKDTPAALQIRIGSKQ